MEIKVIDKTEDFRELKAQWEALQQQDPDVTYYSSFNFVLNAWLSHHHSHPATRLFILCAYHNNVLAGIAPLMIIRKKKYRFLKWNTLTFISVGDFRSFILKKETVTDKGVLKAIFDHIRDSSDQYDEVDLSNILSGSAMASFLMSQIEYFAHFHFLVECPHLFLDRYPSFEAYRKDFISGYTIKYQKRLQRDHTYRFNVTTKPGEALIKQIMDIHLKEQAYLRSRQDRSERHSIFSNAPLRDLLAAEFAGSQANVIFAITTGEGRLIAYVCCYSMNNRLYAYNTAYDISFNKYSPTRVLFYEMLQQLYEGQYYRLLNLGPGKHSYKFEFTDEFKPVYRLHYWNTKKKKIQQMVKPAVEKSKLIRQLFKNSN